MVPNLKQRMANIMSHSYEPSRTSAYDEDLQWRMVWQSLITPPGGENEGVAKLLLPKTLLALA